MTSQTLKISNPGVPFAALKLRRDVTTGQVSFDWAPIERICEASGIDPCLFKRSHEDNVSGLIVAWYQAHREAGGAPDPVAEQLIAEVLAEMAFGEASVQSSESVQ